MTSFLLVRPDLSHQDRVEVPPALRQPEHFLPEILLMAVRRKKIKWAGLSTIFRPEIHSLQVYVSHLLFCAYTYQTFMYVVKNTP